MIFRKSGLKSVSHFRVLQNLHLSGALPVVLVLPSCKDKEAGGPPQMPPAAVTFLPAARESITLTRDLPGRIDAVRVSEVRARVPGILLKREFEEGSEVKEGDVLFRIDPAPLQAAKDSSEADLMRAEATVRQAMATSERLAGLVKMNAVSKQEAEDAAASVAVAEAEIKAAKSALVTAGLNLGYATVTAPINGIIGRAEVTEGALVGQGAATLLAVIRQLDPIYFDFSQSSGDLLALRKAMSKNKESGNEAANEVTLLLDDGTEYEHKGTLLFSDVSVDESTGMVGLRAEFPNPEKLLLPGMFARARMIQAIVENVVTVPQRALTRTANGKGSVLVVNDENKSELKIVETNGEADRKWLISSGLEAGEKVIMEGSLKARPGSPVNATPFEENVEEQKAAEKPEVNDEKPKIAREEAEQGN